jgi:nucleoside-diphosphate-sugar epimerase
VEKNRIIEEDAKDIASRVDLSELSGKEILITGASGLIGTYFLYSLKECMARGLQIKKVHIVCKNQLPEYLQIFSTYPWIELWQGDLCEDGFANSLPECDYIIHGAGYGQPAKYIANDDKTLKINTAATFALLEKIKEHGKFLFISSSIIYNGLQKETYYESDAGVTTTLHPRAGYIEGKRCGEAICFAYRKKGVEAKAARLSFTYGPGVRQGDERAMCVFIEKGLRGNIALLDQGCAERIYCYVADAVEIMWNILLFGKEPVYNVGGKEKVTILELAQKIGKVLGVPVTVPKDGKNGVPGAAPLERLDISKLEKEFGKTTFVPLGQGVERTIQWMQGQYVYQNADGSQER